MNVRPTENRHLLQLLFYNFFGMMWCDILTFEMVMMIMMKIAWHDDIAVASLNFYCKTYILTFLDGKVWSKIVYVTTLLVHSWSSSWKTKWEKMEGSRVASLLSLRLLLLPLLCIIIIICWELSEQCSPWLCL